MNSFEVKDSNNNVVGNVELTNEVFDYPVKPWLMQEVVLSQLAKKRSGTHSTKGRSEVQSSGHKPWKQKGTGRARAGTAASPIWTGGGVVFGPKPRDYGFKVNKKKVKNALRSAIRSKFEDNSISILDGFEVSSGKTKDAVKVISNFNADRKILIIHDNLSEKTILSLRNIRCVKLLNRSGLNVYDIINARHIFILKDAFTNIMEDLV